MNKIYKVIWNRVRHCYVVVSEIAKNHGKEHSTNLCVSKRLVALTLAIGLSLSSYAFVAAEDPVSVNLDHGASAYYDDKGNLTIGKQTVAEGSKQEGKNNTTIGTQTDTLRNVTEGETTKEGQPLDDDSNTVLVDGEGKAHPLNLSTEAGGSTAVGYQNKAEGDNSTAIGNNAKITNKPVTYYVDADGNKTASPDNAAWYKNASGNPTKVPQVFRDAAGKTTTTPQYVHTYTEKDTATGKDVTKTEITSDAAKADKDSGGNPVYNYEKADNTDKLYTVTLYQAASNSIAAGTNVTANGSNAVAVGYGSIADNSAVAIGDTAVAVENAVAMGKDTKATEEGSIALGKGSEADRSGGVAGWDPKTGIASTKSDVAWKSGEGALSIGNGGASRQITHVAAGSEDSDAVNLAQLKNAMTHYYSVKTTEATDAAGGNNYLNDGATGNNALAAGVSAVATGDNATAVGTNTYASGMNASAYGYRAVASGSGSVAIGSGTSAQQEGSVAIGGHTQGSHAVQVGTDSTAQSAYSVAVGGHAKGEYSVEVGYGATAQGSYSTSIGGHAIGKNSIAIGSENQNSYSNPASAGGDNSIAIGGHTNSINDIAIGAGSSTSGGQAIAVGGSATGGQAVSIGGVATSSQATAVGNGSAATGSQSTAVGGHAGNVYSTAVGQGANATYAYTTAVGNNSTASGDHSTALGYGTSAQGSNTTAIGGANANGTNLTVIGNNSTAGDSYWDNISNSTAIGGAHISASDAAAIGSNATVNGQYGVALGHNSNVSYASTGVGEGTKASNTGTAVGYGAQSSGNQSAAVGAGSQATGQNAVSLGGGGAWGDYSIALGSGAGTSAHAIALGQNSGAWGENAIAIGEGTNAWRANSIVLGKNSKSGADKNIEGYDPRTGVASVDDTSAWYSTDEAISIGRAEERDDEGNITVSAITRQLNNLAAGTLDTDAVNVAQLKAATQKVNMHDYSVWSPDTETDTNYTNKGAIAKNSMAAGVSASTTKDAENAVAIGYGAQAEGKGATVIGKNAKATGQYATAFGGLEITDKKTGKTVNNVINTASGASSTAFGQGTQARGNASLAFGLNTIAGGADGSGQQSVAFGEDTQALGGRSLAFGEKTIAKYNDSVAFGNDTRASSTGATAFGNRTRALSQYATAWGNATVAADEESTAWGTDTIAGAKLDENGAVTNKYTEDNTAKTEQMDVHGNLAYVRDGKTAGIKQMPIDSGTEKHDYVVLAGKDGNTYVRDYQGSLWKVNVDANGTATVDTTAGKDGKVYNGKNGAKESLATTTVKDKTTGKDAEVAITPDNVLIKAHEGKNGYTIDGYANATAFGYSTEASGDNATAFGNDTKASAAGATAFGYQTVASGENATAFGENSIAAAKNSLAALGGSVSATATNAAAIGKDAKVNLADSVALGSGAVADRASGVKGYDMLTKGDTTNTSKAWVSSANAVAVGNGNTLTRQITGVAAGSQDTDAVNVAQLKAAGFKVTTQNDGSISSAILNGDTLDFEGKNNAIVSTSKDSKTITVAVSKTPTFDSATFYNPNPSAGQNNEKVTIANGQVTAGTAQIGSSPADTLKLTENGKETEKTAPAGSYVTGLSNKDWNTTNPSYVSGRAATEDQLAKVSEAIGNAATAAGKRTVVTVNDKANPAAATPSATVGAYGDYDSTGGNLMIAAKKDSDGVLTYNIKLNDQLAIGKNGTDGQDGKDGKDGKVTVKTSKGTTVVIGHDGKDGKDGISVKGQDGKDGVTISADNGKDGKDGTEGHIGLTGRKGADGKNADIDISTVLGKATLDRSQNEVKGQDEDGTKDRAARIRYQTTVKNDDGSLRTITHEVATMDDGLKFVGNDDQEVTRKLNETLSIKGGLDKDAVAKASTKNLGVRQNATKDGLEIVMTNTPDFTKVTVGKGDDTTKKITIGEQPNTDTKNPANGNYITGLDNTKWDKDHVTENRAATEGQLRDVAGSITNQANGGGFALTSDEKGDDKIVKQDLGKAIQIKGDTTYKADGTVEKAGNIKTSIDVDNKAIKVELNKDVDLTKDGSIKAGETTINKDGVNTNEVKVGDITITNQGINGGAKQITNMASGIDGKQYGDAGDNNAASIGDVKQLARNEAKASEAKSGKNITVKDDHTVNLNDDITLGNDPIKQVTVKGSEGQVTIGSGDKTLTLGQQVNGAGDKNPVTGKFLNGLDNRNWDGEHIQNGRAATEDQLKTVSDAVKSAAATAGKHTVVTVEGGKDAGTTDYNGENLKLKVTDTAGQKTYDLKLSDKLNLGTVGKNGEKGTDGSIGLKEADGKSSIGLNGKEGISVIGKDGKNGVSITGSNGLNGKDGIDGKIAIGTPGKDGQPGKDAVSISGQNGIGHIGLTGQKGEDGKDGVFTDLSTTLGTATLDPAKNEQSKSADKVNANDKSSRIQYQTTVTDKDGKTKTVITHEVATMDDGQKYAGDFGDGASVKLNKTVNVKGNAKKEADLTDGNIGVVSSQSGDNGQLLIKLNKDLNLGDNGSVKMGNTTINNDGMTISKTESGKTTTVTLTDKGLNNGGNKITNVAAGTDGTDAVNVSQLNDVKTLAGQHTTVEAGSKNITVKEGKNSTGGKNYTVDLAKDVAFGDSAKGDKTVAISGTNGTVTAGTGDNKVIVDGSKGQIIAGGDNGVKIGNIEAGDSSLTIYDKDGNATNKKADGGKYVTNLGNKTWNADGTGSYVSGRAATEDQLHQVESNVNKQIADVNTKVDKVDKHHTEVTVNGGTPAKEDGAYTDGNLQLKQTTGEDGQKVYDLKLNDQLKVGQKGDAGKAGKDGNVTVETKGGTTVVIGHDGKDGKDGRDGLFVTGKDGKDGKSGVSITGPNGVAGKDGVDGKVGIAGKDGRDAVSIAGKDGVGHIGLTGPKGADGKDGTNIDISTVLGKGTLDRNQNEVKGEDKDGTKDQAARIQYQTTVKEADGTTKTITHEVATMDDGMKYGDDFGNTAKVKLNHQLDIVGDINAGKKDGDKKATKDDLSDGNIGIVATDTVYNDDGTVKENGKMTVKLAKDLKGLNSIESNSVTTGNTTINNGGLTIKTGDANRTITVQDGNVNMGGNQIHNVAPGQAPGDAVNVSQLNATNYAVNKLGTRVNRVGAGAAALAALHPLDFDPDDKWDFAAGYGNYKDASAVAVGAYYRPNEDTMFNIGGSFGGGENMVNAGVSFKVGQGNHVSTSRVAMAKEIKDLRQNVANLNAIVNRQSALIDKLTGTNAGMIKDKGNDLFPDVPANHWAYEYVTKLKQAGILTGYPDGNFDGDRMMTRYEFAAIVYRAIMAGAASNPALNQDGTLDKLANEFSSEMKYIRIDTIAKDKNGKPTIERVRVIPDTQHDVQS